MEIFVSDHSLKVGIGGDIFECAIGRSGYSALKKEGDGATPVGSFKFREVFYRPDKMSAPKSGLPVSPIDKLDGWCDDPAHGDYNRKVRLPFSASHEQLWRDDDLYDLVVVIGYNDQPVQQGAGSAIFLHVADPNFKPTEGCVAIELPSLLSVVERLTTDSLIVISNSRQVG